MTARSYAAAHRGYLLFDRVYMSADSLGGAYEQEPGAIQDELMGDSRARLWARNVIQDHHVGCHWRPASTHSNRSHRARSLPFREDLDDNGALLAYLLTHTKTPQIRA